MLVSKGCQGTYERAKVPQKIPSDQTRGENAHYLLSLWPNRPYTSLGAEIPQSQIIDHRETTEGLCHGATRGLELSTALIKPVDVSAEVAYW